MLFRSLQEFGTPMFLLHLCLMVVTVATLFMFAAVRWSMSSLVILFNQLLRLFRNEVAHRKVKLKDRASYFVIAQYFLLMTGTLSVLLVVSVIEVPFGWTRSSSILYTLVHALVVEVYLEIVVAIFGFVCSFPYMYFTVVKQRLNGRRLEMCDLEMVVANWRSLAILSNYFNASYCKLVVPGLKFMVSLAAMTTFLIGIRLKHTDVLTGVLSHALFVTALYLFSILMLGTHLVSGLWIISSNFLWRFSQIGGYDKEERKYVRSYARSFQPLRFAVGSFYNMEREAKLTFADKLATGTANLLIAFK